MSFPVLSETPLEEVTNCVEEKGIPMDGFLAKCAFFPLPQGDCIFREFMHI